MKNKKRCLALLLCLLLSLPLAACGEKPASSGDWVPAATYKGCFSDSGYYFLSGDGLLHYADLSTGTTVNLCPKVGCQHDDETTCEGYIFSGSSYMFFWNEGLYYIAHDPYGDHLYRRNADGTALSTVCTLCEDYMREFGDINIVIRYCVAVDGMLYYDASIGDIVQNGSEFTSERATSVIRRINLRTGKEETVVEDRENTLQLLCARADGVLYSSLEPSRLEDFADKDEYIAEAETLMNRFYQWSEADGELKLLLEKPISECVAALQQVGGNVILCDVTSYVGEEHIDKYYTYDLSTGEYSLLYEGVMDILIAGRYRYSRPAMKQRDQRVLEDLQTGEMLPCIQFYDGNYTVRLQCASPDGVVLVRVATNEEGSSAGNDRIFFYVTIESLADGLQEEDCLDFYVEKADPL